MKLTLKLTNDRPNITAVIILNDHFLVFIIIIYFGFEMLIFIVLISHMNLEIILLSLFMIIAIIT